MIYLDHASTTPLHPRVYDAMLPSMQDIWGNPSSPHAKGREARDAIDQSRKTVADHFGVKPQEVIFTASGSESNSLALFGTCAMWERKHKTPGHVILLQTEHSCSLNAASCLTERGWTVTLLPVDSQGILDPETLRNAIQDSTALVSIQWANNEVGTIQPIEDCHAICQSAAVPLHTDAVQPIGQLPLLTPPELTTIAAHKFYGPKGVAALIVREDVELAPQIFGGGQEFSLRAGTENTPGIVGLSQALSLACEHQPEEEKRLTALRDAFIEALETLPNVSLNGHRTKRLPNNISIHIEGHTGETVVAALDMEGICVATGSACVTGSSDPSHVLLAMGHTKKTAKETVRISLGLSNTDDDIVATVSALSRILHS